MEIGSNLICDVCGGKVSLLHQVVHAGQKLYACLACVNISVALTQSAAQHYMQADICPICGGRRSIRVADGSMQECDECGAPEIKPAGS